MCFFLVCVCVCVFFFLFFFKQESLKVTVNVFAKRGTDFKPLKDLVDTILLIIVADLTFFRLVYFQNK
jgi:hypothetical protein